jgi:cation diffusion facilitator CzcD-associated flavoprotein CzcO
MQTLVIGAGGASGLAAIHAIHNCDAIESDLALGGVWRNVYDSLVTNLPKHVMQYSDLAYPERVSTYPMHHHVVEYMQNYAKCKGLLGKIEFGSRVDHVCRDKERWRVCVNGIWREYKNIVVCSGVK